jgi:hypothetical protein
MLFNHRTTLEEVRDDVSFLEEIGECKPATVNSSVDPHFGAPLTNAMRRDGVLIDEGLSMSSAYLDPRVATLKRIAEATSEAFVPYMNLIAGLQSSVTYEWRRRVPGRSPEVSDLLDAFENRVNKAFTAPFKVALNELARSNADDAALRVEASAAVQLREVSDDLIVPKALLLQRISEIEGGLHYWTQGDLIRNGEVAVAR